MRQSNSGRAYVSGMFAGALIGAGLGLLFAPRAGSELREQVADSAASMGKRVSGTVNKLTRRGREVYEGARGAINRTGEDVGREEVERMADEAAENVEKGMAVAG